MVPYLLLLFLPLLPLAGRLWAPAQERAALLLAGAALLLFIGFRREVGGDWESYALMLHRARTSGALEALTLSDPGYMLLNVAATRLGFGIGLVNLACAALFVTGLVAFARRQPLPHLVLLITLPVLVLTAALAATRQSAAIGLVLWAIASFGAGRARPAVAMLAAAFFFHWTAAIMLPLIGAMLVPKLTPGPIVAAGALAAAGLAALFLTLPGLAERAAEAAVSEGAVYRAVPTLAALALLAITWRRLALDDAERRIAAYLAAVALLSLSILPFASTAADRFGLYAVPLQMMVFSRAAALAPDGWPAAAAQALSAAPFAAMLAGWLVLSPYRACFIPYRTYLAAPADLRLGAPGPPRHGTRCWGAMGARAGAAAR